MWYWSVDTLFWQLSIDHNIDVQSVFSWESAKSKSESEKEKVKRESEKVKRESARVNIGMPVVRTDGRSFGVRSRDNQIFWDG